MIPKKTLWFLAGISLVLLTSTPKFDTPFPNYPE